MNEKSYWTRRVNRRYVLRGGAAAGVGLAAISLVGCGDDDEPTSANTPISGSTQAPGETPETGFKEAELVDTSAEAVRGGIFSHYNTGDETTLDALASSRGAGFGGPGAPAYSRLLREFYAPRGQTPPGIAGDIAESYEIADELTLIFKLRENAKFEPRPPVNGRAITAQDVVFSAEKMRTLSPYASQLFYSVDPASPIESVQAVDDKTVQIKLHHVWSPIIEMLAYGNLVIQPVEADGGFDPRQEPRASGEWMLDSYEQGVAMRWRRNPNWHISSEYPYLDGYDLHIIPEHSVRLAQFRAKALDAIRPSGSSILTAGDIIDITNEFSDVQLLQADQTTDIQSIVFGSREGTPFLDDRIRKAISMSIDRESLGAAFSGADEYADAGISLAYDLDSHLTAGWQTGNYWLDPRDSSNWGEEGKYWQYDPAEAMKLISAADADGLEFTYQASSRAHGSEHQEVLAEFMKQIGLRPNLKTIDYNTEFLPQIWVPGPNKGDFDGLSTGSSGSWQPHPSVSLFTTHHSTGSYTTGTGVAGEQTVADQMIADTFQIFDQEELRSRIHDIQRELAKQMSGIPYTYSNRQFEMWWPWVKNYWVWGLQFSRGGVEATGLAHAWIDESLR